MDISAEKNERRESPPPVRTRWGIPRFATLEYRKSRPSRGFPSRGIHRIGGTVFGGFTGGGIPIFGGRDS